MALDKNLKNLSKLLEALDEKALTKEDVFFAFENIKKYIDTTHSTNKAQLEEVLRIVADKLTAVETRLAAETEKASKKMVDIEKMVSESFKREKELFLEKLQEEVEDKMEELQLPELPDYDEKIEELAKRIPELPEESEDYSVVISELSNELKTALSTIETLTNRLHAVEQRPVRGTIGGQAQGLRFLIDGIKKGLISNMNFKAGSNMAIAYSKVDGQDTITFTSTGGGPGGITVETPTGTVNGSNTTFTVSAEPQWVVADGVTYYDGTGYTYAALTITMDVAPSASIRAII